MSEDINITKDTVCPEDTPCADELKLPGMFDMAKNLMRDSAKIAGNALGGNRTLVEESVRLNRLEICGGCPRYTPEGRCVECGCFMKIKVAFQTSVCPLEKW